MINRVLTMNIRDIFRGGALVVLLAVSPVVHAQTGGLLHWQDNSMTYLYGKGFEVGAEEQHTVTFEHVSGWSAGDLFIFIDSIDYVDRPRTG